MVKHFFTICECSVKQEAADILSSCVSTTAFSTTSKSPCFMGFEAKTPSPLASPVALN